MHQSCLFCHKALGANDLLEQFPVGRRVAFDPERGRLWAVCRRCRRWNLAPLDEDERGVALDALERTWRATPWRASSDNIGLARLDSGVELVRIGGAGWPEFVSWRYARTFAKRRAWDRVGLVVGTPLAMWVFFSIGLTQLVLTAAAIAVLERPILRVLRTRRGGPVIHRADDADAGRPLVVRLDHLFHAELVAPDAGGWALLLKHEEGSSLLSGDAAIRWLRHLTPTLNVSGGSRADVAAAARRLQDAGSAEQLCAEVARPASAGAALAYNYPPDVCLALEMATHEDVERRAMQGELAMLMHEWQAAEQLAGIADKLV